MARAPYSTPGLLPFQNPVSDWAAPRRNALLGFGAGMLSNNMGDIGTSTMRGMELDRQIGQEQQDFAQQAEQTNMTKEWLRQRGRDDLIPLVDAGQGMFALQEATAKVPASTAPSNVQEWEYYNALTPEQQSQYLTMKRSNSPLNIGTGFVTQDPANPGTVLGGPIAIQNEQAAYDTGFGGVTGKAAGEKAVLAESVQGKMPGLRSVIDTLTSLADTATYTQSGQAMDSVKRELGLPVGQGAIDRAAYIAIVDNQVLPLLRDTFGAAFTVQEGESLRATLGNPNVSPAEKKAILDAFITQKERDIAAMTGQPIQAAPSIAAPPAPAPSNAINWSDL